MRGLIMRLDALVRRTERIGWLVLCGVVLLVPWAGLEPPLSGAHGEGYILLDEIVTALLCIAALAQVVRIVQAPDGEHVTVRAAAWLLLLTLCLLAGRLVWILLTVGDIRLTVTMALALLCLASSVLLHSIGRVIYGGL